MRSGPGELKKSVKRAIPKSVLSLYHLIRDGDLPRIASFVFKKGRGLSSAGRAALAWRMCLISERLPCPHTQREMLEVVEAVLSLPRRLEGAVVEAGCYLGGGTAKLSLAAEKAGRKLVVFDSFQGLPEHDEPPAVNIFGETVVFSPGQYRAGLEEVKANVARFGAPGICDFHAGWFAQTMPGFRGPIALLFLDVDLAASTRTALKHLYPRLVPGGVLFSHDGHLPAVISAFRDANFWKREVGCAPPRVAGLGRRKLIRAVKEP